MRNLETIRGAVLLILLGVATVAGVGPSFGGESVSRWKRERVSAAPMKEVAAALEELKQETSAFVAGLMDEASKEGMDNERRRGAVLLLGHLGTAEAMEFCLNNLQLNLEMEVVEADDDELKARPARYALANMGAGTLPKILQWCASRELGKDRAADIAWVLKYVYGDRVASRLIVAWAETRSEVERRRVERVLPFLSKG